jgi:hypothetical protein
MPATAQAMLALLAGMVGLLFATRLPPASYAFIDPAGCRANLFVSGPGGYTFTDFARLGIPITLLVGAEGMEYELSRMRAAAHPARVAPTHPTPEERLRVAPARQEQRRGPRGF